MAPEVVKQEGYGRRADIWSTGCTVVEMATGNAPWCEVSNCMAVMMKIATSKEPPTLPENFSEAGLDFLRQCFKYLADERPSATILTEHKWLSAELRPSTVPKTGEYASRNGPTKTSSGGSSEKRTL